MPRFSTYQVIFSAVKRKFSRIKTGILYVLKSPNKQHFYIHKMFERVMQVYIMFIQFRITVFPSMSICHCHSGSYVLVVG